MPVETELSFVVKGQVQFSDGRPRTRCKVRASDRDMRGSNLLGEAVTDDKGSYEIKYAETAFFKRESGRADLVIHALDSRGKKTIATSATYYNAEVETIIDLVVGDEAFIGPSEYDFILNKIKPLSGKVKISRLVENEKDKDITFLANEIAVDHSLIALLPLAHQLSSKTKVPADIFYGLFRLQFPQTLNELYLVKSDSLLKGITRAIEQNIIASQWKNKAKSIIKQFNQLASGHVLSEKTPDNRTFIKLIDPVLKDRKLNKIFIDTYYENEAKPATFFKKLAEQEGFKGNNKTEEVKFALQVNLLTGNVPALTSLLLKEKSAGRKAASIRDFTKFMLSDWESRVEKIVKSGELKDFPEGVEGKTKKQKIKNYAALLDEHTKALFPVDVFNHRLSNDPDHPFGNAKNDVSRFLKNNPEFDLKTSTINAAMKKADVSGIRDKDGLTSHLKSINRIYKIAPSYDDTSVLLADGLSSSTSIIKSYNQNQFLKQFTPKLGKQKAKSIYQQARQVDQYSTVLALGYKMSSDIPVYALMGGNELSADYQSMFGDNHLCDCEHCQSVNSPSAYLVDVLKFIHDENEAAETLLNKRRPDIATLLLTCENTNTPLRYIDLVNEILEDFISSSGILAHNTTATEEELSAYPEYVNDDAYIELRKTKPAVPLPTNLPFNLPIEETRLYMDKLGCERYQLMELVYATNGESKLNDITIATEYLRLSPQDLNELNKATTVTVSQMKKVSDCLTLTSLSYVELLQLLECQFINPRIDPAGDVDSKRKITIVADSLLDVASCNPEHLKFEGITKATIKKIFPFVRLWRHLGWELFDLDRLFHVLDINTFTMEDSVLHKKLIIPLSHVSRIMGEYDLDVPTSLALWSSLDIEQYRDHSQNRVVRLSLFQRLFQNKKVSSPIDQDFNEPLVLQGTLSDKSSLICSALNISETDLSTLSAKLCADDALSLKNLSVLYRHSQLANILKVSVSELLKIIAITGIESVGDIAKSSETIEFIAKVKFIKNSELKINELAILVNHVKDADIVIHDVTTATFLVTLRDSLKNIDEAFKHEGNDIEKDKNKLLAQRELLIGSMSAEFNIESRVVIVMLDGLVNSTQDSTKPSLDVFIDQGFIDSIDKNLPVASIAANGDTEWLFPGIVDTYILLHKTAARIAYLFDKLSITSEEFVYFQKNEVDLHIEDVWNTASGNNPVEMYGALENLICLINFRNASPQKTDEWFSIFNHAVESGTASKEDFVNALAESYQIPIENYTTLLGAATDTGDKGRLNYAFPADYLFARNLTTIVECVNKSSKLMTAPDVLIQLTKADVTSADASIAQSILKSLHDEKTWLDVIEPISNQLREKKRDALVSYILTTDEQVIVTIRDNNEIDEPNDLYQYFLIDTEMAACMKSSRIKQANSSVQLFIDRCLMGLEKSIVLGEDFAAQWNKWRKQYRVWEANRKVFLYPENWIEPDLRDDKSPFFKELESKLSQNEITDETAKDALLEYLEKLDTIANLEVIGLFPDEITGIDHVIGRTKTLPHLYYYRTQEKLHWSAWEKIELDIESNHILPVVWNNRLMLLWATFTEIQIRNTSSARIEFGNDGNADIKSEKTIKLEIQLNWSEYKNRKWGAKNVSEEKLQAPNNKSKLFMTSYVKNSELYIHVFVPENSTMSNVNSIYSMPLDENGLPVGNGGSGGSNRSNPDVLAPVDFSNKNVIPAGAFVFAGCNNQPTVITEESSISKSFSLAQLSGVHGSVKISPFLSVSPNFNFSIYKNGLYSKNNTNNALYVDLLNKTPEKFRLITSYNELENNRPVKFFYSNAVNNFYVRSVKILSSSSIFDGLLDATHFYLSRNDIQPRPPVFEGDEFLSGNQLVSNETTEPNSLRNGPINSNFVYKTLYKFDTFYHPYACDFISNINTHGIDAIYDVSVQQRTNTESFKDNYVPTRNVRKLYPVENIDFSFSGAYSSYNWELFFHIPLLIATRLSENKKFEESRKWFHYIFDPTSSSGLDGESGPERFWVTAIFKDEMRNGAHPIEELLNNDEKASEISQQLQYWKSNPFNPHGIARLRNTAYMRTTVMKYIDNLIEWGDQLFRRDTMESTNEATLLYVLAANLLGKKPESIPARAQPKIHSYSTLTTETQLDDFANAKVKIEAFLSHSDISDDDTLELEGADLPISMPMFCIPKNNQLLDYWDKVADRLFKLRNCMNVDGVVRQLPLFEPPIDPALLVRATSQGLDLNDILNDIELPLPHYRFQIMVQKANELGNYVKGLGGQLLSALEKKDAEELSLLRFSQEISMLNLIRDIKKKQVGEARENLSSIAAARNITEEKYRYFDSKEYLNRDEKLYFYLAESANAVQGALHLNYALASLSHLIPELKLGSGFTLGTTTGGVSLGNAAIAALEGGQSFASFLRSSGEMLNMKAGYDRRQEDWDFQTRSSKLELKQIDKQITAAEIRLAIVEKELANHDEQTENSKEVDAYMRSKFTNQELYNWMAGQISNVYFQAYQLAHDYAKKAEKCYRFELGNDDSFVSYGYWDSMRKGLQSADNLLHDIQRMETSYIDKNSRGYELVKNISVSMLDPLALMQLKETGKCEFQIPEVLYDMDYPGQYFRRLKSVSISLPCIAGPYTSVSAKLTLDSHSYRHDASDNDYIEAPVGADGRFTYLNGNKESIATSSSQNDSGVFELNFNDERYLPFEGAGAISRWELELPNEIRQFDYNTISDVLLHVKYTAKEGGIDLKTKAEKSLKDQLATIQGQLQIKGLHIPINLKNDLPNEWHLLSNNGSANITVDKSRLPYMAQTIKSKIENVIFVASVKNEPDSVTLTVDDNKIVLKSNEVLNLYLNENSNNIVNLDQPFSIVVTQADIVNLENLLMVVKFSF